MQDQERTAKEQRMKDQEDLDGENQGQSPIRVNLENHPSTSINILTGGHIPMVELGLVPYTHLNIMKLHAWKTCILIPKGKPLCGKLRRL